MGGGGGGGGERESSFLLNPFKPLQSSMSSHCTGDNEVGIHISDC